MKTLKTPLGSIHLVASGDSLSGIFLPGEDVPAGDDSPCGRAAFVEDGGTAPVPRSPDAAAGRAGSPVLDECARQLEEYFEGERREFDLPLLLDGTPFQLEVWRRLAGIPFGVTVSYGELARSLGKPGASRAVGAANGRNRLPIVLPCHRVVGSDGTLTGYAGGLTVKRWLLEHEVRSSG